MPSTPALGIRYPSPDVPPDVPARMRDTAEDVDALVVAANASIAAANDAVAAVEALGPKVLGSFTGGAGTNVTTLFSDIDQSYRMLQLIWRGTHDGTDNGVSLGMRFNGDNTSGNYSSFRGWAEESGAAWDLQELQELTAIHAGMVGGHFGSHGVLWIPMYSNVSGIHVVHGTYLARGTGGVVDGLLWGMGGGAWTPSSNAAITSIQVWPVGQNWDGDAEATLVGYS